MTDKEFGSAFIQRLVANRYRIRLASKTQHGFESHLVDLSSWKLRLSDQTPVIWIKADDASRLSAQELIESLQDVADQQGWRHRLCVALIDAPGQELQALAGARYAPRFIVIDAGAQQRILTAHSFIGAFLDLVCEQIPLANLAPYEVSAPVEGSGFFGREREVDKILTHAETNFAILGSRRIGKTSVLREVRRRLLDQGENPARFVWLDCSTLRDSEQFLQEVVRQLNTPELSRLKKRSKYPLFFPDFLKRMFKMHRGTIIFFLDEADALWLWLREEHHLLRDLRAAANEKTCRFLATGFGNLAQEIFNTNSPLLNVFEPLRLGPFLSRETADVVITPMGSLRVHIENRDSMVGQVHDDTQGHPLLVQYYCLELVSLLDRLGTRTLSPKHVEAVYTSEVIKGVVVNAFRENVTTADKLLVYALLVSFAEDKSMFNQQEMYGALRRQSCSAMPEEIDRACDRLVLANVFLRQGAEYRFANKLLPRVLRANNNPKYLLATAKKELGR